MSQSLLYVPAEVPGGPDVRDVQGLPDIAAVQPALLSRAVEAGRHAADVQAHALRRRYLQKHTSVMVDHQPTPAQKEEDLTLR